MSANKKLIDAYLLIDHANASDPNTTAIAGTPIAKEVIYGIRMTSTLLHFDSAASVALQLAARCQHICRWEIPRDQYPDGSRWLPKMAD